MWGSEKFKWVYGDWTRMSTYATTDLPLSEADANSATAVIERGNMLDIDYVNRKLVYTTGNGVGLLEQRVSLNGVSGSNPSQLVYDLFIGRKDLATVKRGAPASIRVPRAGAIAEFEGLGAAAYGNFVITATTTGHLGGTPTLNSELTVEKGGWRIAQVGEMVLGFLESYTVTPIADAGNRRIAVRFCSPYKLTA